MRCIRYKEACVACLFQVFRIWRIRVWTNCIVRKKTSRRACSTQSQRYCLKGIFIVLPQWHKCRTKLKSVWNPCVIRCYIHILSKEHFKSEKLGNKQIFQTADRLFGQRSDDNFGRIPCDVDFGQIPGGGNFGCSIPAAATFWSLSRSRRGGAWRRHNHRNQFILTLSARYRLVWLYLAQCILSQAIPFLSSLLHWGGVDQALMFPHCTISRLRPRS